MAGFAVPRRAWPIGVFVIVVLALLYASGPSSFGDVWDTRRPGGAGASNGPSSLPSQLEMGHSGGAKKVYRKASDGLLKPGAKRVKNDESFKSECRVKEIYRAVV